MSASFTGGFGEDVLDQPNEPVPDVDIPSVKPVSGRRAEAIGLMKGKNPDHHYYHLWESGVENELANDPLVIQAFTEATGRLPDASPFAFTPELIDLAIAKIREAQDKEATINRSLRASSEVTDATIFEALKNTMDRIEKANRDRGTYSQFKGETVAHIKERFKSVPDASEWAAAHAPSTSSQLPSGATPSSSPIPSLGEAIDAVVNEETAKDPVPTEAATPVPPAVPKISPGEHSAEAPSAVTFNPEATETAQPNPETGPREAAGPLPREDELPPETPQNMRALHRALTGLYGDYTLEAEKKKLRHGITSEASSPGKSAGEGHHHGGSGGGGGRSLLSFGGGRSAAHGERARERAAARHAYAAMETKAVDTLVQNLFHRTSEMGALRLGLKEGVENLNHKVSQDPDFAPWLAKLDDYAASKGVSRPEALDKVYAGDLPGFGEGLRKITEKPEISQMLKDIDGKATDLSNRANDVTNTLESLRKKNIDVSKLEPVFERMRDETTVPDARISDPDAKRRLDKLNKETQAQMQKILEAITKAIKKVLDKIRGTFGR